MKPSVRGRTMKVGIVHLSNAHDTMIFVMSLEFMEDINEDDPMRDYEMLDDENLTMVETLKELTLWLRDNEATIDYEIEGVIY